MILYWYIRLYHISTLDINIKKTTVNNLCYCKPKAQFAKYATFLYPRYLINKNLCKSIHYNQVIHISQVITLSASARPLVNVGLKAGSTSWFCVSAFCVGNIFSCRSHGVLQSIANTAHRHDSKNHEMVQGPCAPSMVLHLCWFHNLLRVIEFT
jgi:hypothetical protein